VYGRFLSSAHGPAPPILEIPRELLDKFASEATDGDLDEFVRIMASGTSDEQEQLIDELINDLLGEMVTSNK